MRKAIIINATNIGLRSDGIGTYSINLVKGLNQLKSDLKFIIYINKNCRHYYNFNSLSPNCEVRVTTKYLSPDYGRIGHLLRLLFSNYLSLLHWKSLCFNTGQLEAMFFRRNQIIMVHDTIPLLFPQDHTVQFFYYKYVLSSVLKKVSAIIVPSQYSLRMLVEYYDLPASKIYVIYHGNEHMVNSDETCGSIMSQDYILYVGRLDGYKNFKLVCAGFKMIVDKLDHILVAIGPIASESSEVSSLPEERIVLKDSLSSREMISLYKHASLLVCPSFSEGFGFPPVEAFVNACPVLASDAGSLPEICGEAAVYINPNDAHSIAEGMYKLATDKILRTRLVEKGRQQAVLYSWNTSAQEHLKVFKQILFD